MTAGVDYVDCGAPVEATWWSQRCGGCQHGLMVHVPGKAADGSDVIVCDMCVLSADAKRFANGVKADVRAYVDQQDTKYQATAKNYVDTQIPLVIKQKVVATALLP